MTKTTASRIAHIAICEAHIARFRKPYDRKARAKLAFLKRSITATRKALAKGKQCVVTTGKTKQAARFIGLYLDAYGDTQAVVAQPDSGLHLTLVHPSRVAITSN
jgi:hypothetical protein